MSEIKEKEQSTTHKIGIYLWIWGLLFVLSFFSYMVDWYQFQGMLRWSLILVFMFAKAGLIMAFFMHLYWERYALVNVLLWPMTAIACFIFLMVAEFEYTVFTRLFYFVVGGSEGFPKHLISKAKKILAVSKMVFPHKIARLILVEQLYRAKCIINRHPYHKA